MPMVTGCSSSSYRSSGSGRVICEPALVILAGIHLFTLLAAAATDRTFLFDPQVGDTAARACNRLAAHDDADGHAEHDKYHHEKHDQPGHCSAPAPNSSSDRKSTRLNSSHVKISYAVFCL